MKYLLLDGFPKGLDARKFNLSAPPGTLVELTNGHLTNGGEIEKRKAFVAYANVAITETGATATAGIRTFGLQKTATGLTVFGSALANGVSPGATAQPNLASAMPAGVTYQQLQHPAVGDGETYVAASHAMTAVLSSTSYGGLIYALATFQDGNTFGYYDGVLHRDFTDGLIMAHLNTNTKIATAIKEMVNRSDNYLATNPSADVAQVTGPVGAPYGSSVIEDSAGTLTANKVSDPTPAFEARQAIGSFKVIAGSYSANVNKIVKVEVGPAAGPLVTITPTSGTTYVDWTNSNEFTASLLAAAINLKASTPEYTAEANGDTVTIKALQTDGDASNDYVVVVTAAGNVCVGKVQFQIQSVSAFNITALMINGVTVLTGGSIAVGNAAVAALAVVADINASTGTHGYIANATGAVVSISKAVTRSDDADLPVYFVHDGTTGSGNGVFEVGGNGGSVSSMRVVLIFTGFTATDSPRAGATRGYFNFSLAVSGGVAPYLAPVWYGNGATPVNQISSSQYRMVGYTYLNTAVTPPSIYCVVTDSAGMTERSNDLN